MWGGAFLEKRDLVRITSIAYNGMANQVVEMQTGNVMVVALKNLVNAAVQKNDTVEQLVISNSSLSASLMAHDTKIARILTVITNLNNVKAAGAPWVPMGYCWLHVFKIRVGHCSVSCENRKDRHNTHLTVKRGKIQGGCKWNQNWTPMGN